MRDAAVCRHQVLPSSVVLLSLIHASAAAPWDGLLSGGKLRPGECPQGYYRSEAILFGCHHMEGTAHHLLAPAARTRVVNIPAGVKNFTIEATADTSIGLQLTSLRDDSYIVNSISRRPGIITDRRRSGTFEGMLMNFSGEDSGAVDMEKLEMFGKLPSATVLRFVNRDSNWGTVAMNFTYDGLESCPDVPEGCDLYDEDVAWLEVMDWSKWAQSQFESADEAWLMRAAPHVKSVAGGVFWHSWPAVWSRRLDEPEKLEVEDWEPAFHYVDADRDGEVSQAEFEAAYNAASDQRSNFVSTIISSVPNLLANHTLAVLPDLHKANWHNRGWLIAAGLLLLGLLGGPAVALFCRRRTLRTRGIRSVRSRDSDGKLELSDASSEQDLDVTFSGGCAETGYAQEHSYRIPGMLMPLLGPFWHMDYLPELWRSPDSRVAVGHMMPTAAVRYGPVPTAEEPAIRPVTSVQVPPQSLQRLQSPRPRVSDFPPRSSSMELAESGSVSLSVAATGASFGPLKVIQASPEQLESLKAAPKVHVVEKSQSFTSSPGQARAAVPALKLERDRLPKLDYKAPSSTPGSPQVGQPPLSPPGGKQAPWAAVFTPEEWERATQLANQSQPQLSPNRAAVRP